MGEIAALRSPITWDAGKEKEIETETSMGKENALDLDTNTSPSKPSLQTPDQDSGPAAITQKSRSKHRETTTKIVETSVTKRRENKKRNKWSEEETKDLLQGVSKYGIGNWKKILSFFDQGRGRWP